MQYIPDIRGVQKLFLLHSISNGVRNICLATGGRFIEKTKPRFMSWGAEQMKAGSSNRYVKKNSDSVFHFHT